MIKLVFCCRRKEGVSLEEFQRYWLESHAPLVRSLREALPEMKRYVQCHTIPGPATDLVRAGRGTAEPFDGVTEVWVDELPSGDEPMTEAAVEAGMRLLQDELTFVDMARSSVFFTVEHEIF